MGKPRAAIYVRISQDREGAGLGVQRQEVDCRALAKRKGWAVAETYTDDDVSAYSGRPRPAWNRLREDIEAGAVDAVVAWHVDRLTRSPRELEDVIDFAERQGLELATVTGDIDLATPTGRLVARMLGAAARHESEHKSERQLRERRQNAERGLVAGGGHRPFGYADDGVTVLEDEAEVVREMASRVLAGESLTSICRDLMARGVITPLGKAWTPTSMRRLLASARISGRREHTPKSAYGSTRPLVGEIVADAVWEGIVSVDDSDRLRRMLSDPSRRKFSPATGRKYLLSGVLKCGLCGNGLVGCPREGVPRYICHRMPGRDHCGGVATNAQRTDEFVRDMVLVALDSDEMRAALTRRDDVDPELAAAVARDEAALVDLAAEKDDGVIARGEYLSRRTRIEKRLQASRTKLARATHAQPLGSFVGTYEEMLERWDAMNLSQRRAIVGAVLDRVDVQSADPRRRWDPARFTPVWKA
ncbi:MAG TPA: recombinase family protein [Mycobacteriales bacterium]|nr:recombinase family protein [Mycobacteriales bacterium]